MPRSTFKDIHVSVFVRFLICKMSNMTKSYTVQINNPTKSVMSILSSIPTVMCPSQSKNNHYIII